jgi:hypothetical protein
MHCTPFGAVALPHIGIIHLLGMRPLHLVDGLYTAPMESFDPDVHQPTMGDEHKCTNCCVIRTSSSVAAPITLVSSVIPSTPTARAATVVTGEAQDSKQSDFPLREILAARAQDSKRSAVVLRETKLFALTDTQVRTKAGLFVSPALSMPSEWRMFHGPPNTQPWPVGSWYFQPEYVVFLEEFDGDPSPEPTLYMWSWTHLLAAFVAFPAT